jgi:hypothetical protein
MLEKLQILRKNFAQCLWKTIDNPPYGGERIVFAFSNGVFSDMDVENLSIGANGKEIYQFSELVNEIEKYTDKFTQKSEAMFCIKDYFELICEDFISQCSAADLYLFKDNHPYWIEDISMYRWLSFIQQLQNQNKHEIAAKAFVYPLHNNSVDERSNADNLISCAKYMLQIGKNLNWAEREISQHIATQLERHITTEEKDLKLSTWVKNNIHEKSWSHFNYLRILDITEDEIYTDNIKDTRVYAIKIDGYKLQTTFINKAKISTAINDVLELLNIVAQTFNNSESLKAMGLEYIHITHNNPNATTKIYDASYLYCNISHASSLTQQGLTTLINESIKQLTASPIANMKDGYTSEVTECIKEHLKKWSKAAFLAYKLENEFDQKDNSHENTNELSNKGLKI